METAIFVAAIGAATTILGWIVTHYLANRSKPEPKREFTREQLRSFAEEIERTRIVCWSFRDILFDVIGDDDKLRSRDRIESSLDRFNAQIEKFELAWAPIRSEVPEEDLDHLRVIRHDSRHALRGASRKFDRLPREFLDFDPSYVGWKERMTDYVDHCNKLILEALSKLDQLETRITALIKQAK